MTLCSWYAYHPCFVDDRWNKLDDTGLKFFAIRMEVRAIVIYDHRITCRCAHTVTHIKINKERMDNGR